MTPHIRQSGSQPPGLTGLLAKQKNTPAGLKIPDVGETPTRPLSDLDFGGAKRFADVMGHYSRGAYAPLKPLAAQEFSSNRPVPIPTRPIAPLDAAGLQHAAAPTDRERLEKMAEKWVGTTFFGALLKQMRESPWRSELLDGGKSGQAFQSLYDQHMADRLAKGAGKKLVRSVVRKFESQKAYATHAKKPASLNDATMSPASTGNTQPTKSN